MSGHFYKRTEGGIEFLKNVKTPAQARKSAAYPSVTTILKLMPSDHIDRWRLEESIRLAREFPEYKTHEILDRLWGVRECPNTGDEISSSEFGTAVHAQMEDFANLAKDSEWPTPDDDGYSHFCLDAIKQFKKRGVEPISAEEIVFDDDLRIAGTIDLLAKIDGKVSLLDYKCRSCKGEKAKSYNKDCAQLAIEAAIVANDMDLDYFPPTYTVCICSDTGKAWLRKWTAPVVKRNLGDFLACRMLYMKAESKMELGEVLEGHTLFVDKSGL
jgi:ATP-dependent exoDNAse (exonuclease V) beta subunit